MALNTGHYQAESAFTMATSSPYILHNSAMWTKSGSEETPAPRQEVRYRGAVFFFLDLHATVENEISEVACAAASWGNGSLQLVNRFTENGGPDITSSLTRFFAATLEDHNAFGVLCAYDGRARVFPALCAAMRNAAQPFPPGIATAIDGRALVRATRCLCIGSKRPDSDALRDIHRFLFLSPLVHDFSVPDCAAALFEICSHEYVLSHLVLCTRAAAPSVCVPVLDAGWPRSFLPSALHLSRASRLHHAVSCGMSGQRDDFVGMRSRDILSALLEVGGGVQGVKAARKTSDSRRFAHGTTGASLLYESDAMQVDEEDTSAIALPAQADDRSGWMPDVELGVVDEHPRLTRTAPTVKLHSRTSRSEVFDLLWCPVESLILTYTNQSAARQSAARQLGAFAKWLGATRSQRQLSAARSSVTPSSIFTVSASTPGQHSETASETKPFVMPCHAWHPISSHEFRVFVGLMILTTVKGGFSVAVRDWWSQEPGRGFDVARRAMSRARFLAIAAHVRVTDPAKDDQLDTAAAFTSALSPAAKVLATLMRAFRSAFEPGSGVFLSDAETTLVVPRARRAGVGKYDMESSGARKTVNPDSVRIATAVDEETGYLVTVALSSAVCAPWSPHAASPSHAAGAASRAEAHSFRAKANSADAGTDKTECTVQEEFALGRRAATAACAAFAAANESSVVVTGSSLSSLRLFSLLYRRNLCAFGRIIPSRAGFPLDLFPSSGRASASVGTSYMLVRDGLCAIARKGDGLVHMISSLPTASQVLRDRAKATSLCTETEREAAPSEAASLCKLLDEAAVPGAAEHAWERAVFHWALGAVLKNAAILFQLSSKSSHGSVASDFVWHIGTSLAKNGRTVCHPPQSEKSHRLVHVGPQGEQKQASRRPALRCFVCSHSRKREARTVYQCECCEVPMCGPGRPHDCFGTFHENLDYWLHLARSKRRRVRKQRPEHDTLSP